MCAWIDDFDLTVICGDLEENIAYVHNDISFIILNCKYNMYYIYHNFKFDDKLHVSLND